jgi:hypothetical protein
MNIGQLASIGELIGGVDVLCTLIFLAIED